MRMGWSLMLTAVLGVAACTSTGGDKKEGESGLTLDKVKAEGKKLEAKAAPYTDACKAETEKYCKVDKSDPAKLHSCLKANKDKAGPQCRDALTGQVKAKAL
ncbi:MAG: hypothetical protein FJ146_10840 [Deltaproteobacteria bacterium]|nr:hypothetical protein [Deltaproteobacteria bacterium]